MKNTDDSVEKTIELRAPRARVWRAISNAQDFGTWFGLGEPLDVVFDGVSSVDNSGMANPSRFPSLPRAALDATLRDRTLYGSDFPIPSNAFYYPRRLGARLCDFRRLLFFDREDFEQFGRIGDVLHRVATDAHEVRRDLVARGVCDDVGNRHAVRVALWFNAGRDVHAVIAATVRTRAVTFEHPA